MRALQTDYMTPICDDVSKIHLMGIHYLLFSRDTYNIHEKGGGCTPAPLNASYITDLYLLRGSLTFFGSAQCYYQIDSGAQFATLFPKCYYILFNDFFKNSKVAIFCKIPPVKEPL